MPFARLIRKYSRTVDSRLDDGTLQETVTHWTVEAVDEFGQVQVLEFPANVSPSDQDVIDRLPRATDLVPASKADLEEFLDGPFERWQRWKTTRLEAQARAAPAAVVTALQTREDTAWKAYLQSINAWRTAT